MSQLKNAGLSESIVQLKQLAAALRDKQSGCPWDLEQSHQSLAPFTIEEAYELAHAIRDPEYKGHLVDELSDILFHIVLHSQIAEEAGDFNLEQVIQHAVAKFTRRHPHVFGTPEQRKQRDLDSIWREWKNIKKAEKASRQSISKRPPSGQIDTKIESTGPASKQADLIGKKMANIGFDWNTQEQVLAHLQSEIDELKHAMQNQESSENILDELGDTFFTLAQLARKLGVCPEKAAEHGNQKFIRRFQKVEQLAAQREIEITNASALNKLWGEVKMRNKTLD